ARAESSGFETAAINTSNGPRVDTNTRNNDRVIIDDIELARELRITVRILAIVDGASDEGFLQGSGNDRDFTLIDFHLRTRLPDVDGVHGRLLPRSRVSGPS